MGKKTICLTNLDSNRFSQAVIDWYQRHGRKTLPWQKNKTPYRVWLSEIMLQQTQVTTVIDYFYRFTKRFPTLASLSHADEEAVLQQWSGLGYYARARNLHRAARIIAREHHGRFPRDLDTLQQLPGIGRSTAGAILSLSYGKTATILDGNVKRVLSRFKGITQYSGLPLTLKKLWALAEDLTPATQCHFYNQAMMDLGALICTRKNPRCNDCPLQQGCYSYQYQLTEKIPAAKPKKIMPVKTTTFLLLQNHHGHVLLEKRPARGIWGGLWCFPESSALDIHTHCRTLLNAIPKHIESWNSFRHTFTHFHLDITPIYATIRSIKTPPGMQWYPPTIDTLGLAAPITRLLRTLQDTV